MLEKSIAEHFYNYLIPKYENKKNAKEPIENKNKNDDYYNEEEQ